MSSFCEQTVLAGNKEGFPTVPETKQELPYTEAQRGQVNGRTEEIVCRGPWRGHGAKLHIYSLCGERSESLLVLWFLHPLTINPSSHVLGKHYLQQETTEDPAKSCYGLRLPAQRLFLCCCG